MDIHPDHGEIADKYCNEDRREGVATCNLKPQKASVYSWTIRKGIPRNAKMQKKQSENDILEKLFNEEVKLNEHSSQLHQRVLNKMLETLIEQAKEVSPDFREVFREIFYGGSYFDKLKVKSTPYEYDLNFVFYEPKSSFDICNLGDDFRKPNFATLRTNCHNLSPVWKNLIGKDRQNNNIISPKKMFDLLHRTIDQALTKLGKKFKLDGQEYRQINI